MTTHTYGSEYTISCHRVNENDTSLLEQFRCEYPAISRFVKKECLNSKRDVTYLFIDEENNRIIGVCAICCSGISTIEEDDGEFYRTNLPSIEIDYFAIDEDYRKLLYDAESTRYETLSKALFLKMIVHIDNISKETVGATHINLYAVPKAVNFYKRCGFEEFDSFMVRDEVPFTAGCTPMYYVL